MAKKTVLDQTEEKIPNEREFHIGIPANTTAEAAAEIDTGIKARSNVGWVIYGLRWQIQNIASPHARISLNWTVAGLVTVQLCRGEEPATPVLLSAGDNQLIMEDTIDIMAASAASFIAMTWPRIVRKLAVTQLPKLYVMFQSNVDFTALAETSEIVGHVLYHEVEAPAAPRESV